MSVGLIDKIMSLRKMMSKITLKLRGVSFSYKNCLKADIIVKTTQNVFAELSYYIIINNECNDKKLRP